MSMLTDNQVRVRLATVTHFDGAALDRFTSTFSDDELERVVRLETEQLRTEFVVAHGVLREMLSAYLEVDPASIVFSVKRGEKPRLVSPSDTGIDFSLAHSGGKVLYAFATGRRVGADIKKLDPSKCDAAIVQTVFTHQEMREWRSLPEGHRVQGFFRGWVRKEAFMNAVGPGIDAKSFSVTINPKKPASVDLPPELAAEQWSLHALKVGSDYLACVAVEGTGYELLVR